MLWTFLGVLIGLAALYVLYGKVRETYQRNKQMNAPENKLADEISAKLLEKLEPRFSEIERKLANDKALIENHTRQIETINRRTDSQDAGIRALCHGMAALLDNAEKCGSAGAEIKAAKKMFTDYLADK
jgi:uncharacterized protein HemX